MHGERLLLKAAYLSALLSLLLASCAPAIAPTPTAKPAGPPAPPTSPVPKQTPAAPPAAPPKPAAPAPIAKPAAPSSTPKPAGEQPKYGGIMALPHHSDPPHLDIHGTVASALFSPMGAVYNGIVQFDKDTEVVPDLAERWDVSPDGKVYTFHLREGVKWHDVKPFTSTDARFSIERIMAYRSMAYIVDGVEKVDAVDESTLKVTLDQRRAGFLPLIAHGRALIGAKHVVEANKDLKKVAVGTGPFKLKEYMSGVSFRMERNPDYFVKGRPYLDGIVYYLIKDAATRFAGFRTNRLQMAGTPPCHTDLGPTQAAIIKQEMPAAVVRPYELMMGWVLLPNWTRSPWKDVRVRRAAFLAVDREKALEVVSEGNGDTGISFYSGQWALPKDELNKMPGFRKPKDQDIAEAKELLAQAGHPNGFESSVLVRAAYPMYEKGALFMRAQLAKIGIDLKLQVLEYAVWTHARNRRAYDTMLVMSSPSAFDPDEAGRFISWKLGGQWASDDDERLLQLHAAQSAAATSEERKKAVFELQRMVAELVPHVMGGWQYSFIAFWPEVKGYVFQSGVYSHNKFDEVWLAK
ncbi:MAG: ABC transporter substrate-binding protein [Chloroflexota bacterium]